MFHQDSDYLTSGNVVIRVLPWSWERDIKKNYLANG